LNIKIEDGIKVIIKGRVTTYDLQSKYQLIVNQIDYEGEGTLLQILENRKKKLASLGFFDLEKKIKIPEIPSNVGVITSETGAVINDIIHRISDRYPLTLTLYPANVQGEKSLNDLLNGIKYFNKSTNPPDLIIIARGGGSLEDLMSFNEEKLVIAIHNSTIPVISAVGHETDFTLCDLVSDLRAPTPTAAAEIAVPDRKELLSKINSSKSLLDNIILKNLGEIKIIFSNLSSRLPDLSNNINNKFQTLDLFETKITQYLKSLIDNTKLNFYKNIESLSKRNLTIKIEYLYENLENLKLSLISNLKNIQKYKETNLVSIKRQLLSLSYKNTLKRGFSVVKYENKLVQSEKQLVKDKTFEIEFYKDRVLAKKI
jgi:exodeoxyribonuclease VII large subunit